MNDLEDRISFFDHRRLPAILTPEGLDLDHAGADAVQSLLGTEVLQGVLRRYGAVLLRGFELSDGEVFAEVAGSYFGDSSRAYLGGTSPRAAVHGNTVYESTRFPVRLRLPQHNEMSYLRDPPRELMFFCEIPPRKRGETPLADCRRILAELSPEVRQEFETRGGVRYVRYYFGSRWNPGRRALNRLTKLHRPWREAFETDDRAVVEAYCRDLDLELDWDRRDGVQLRNRLPAIVRHPTTDEPVWFNQAATFLVTPRGQGLLRYIFYHLAYPEPGRRPFHVTFGDGSRIPLRHLHRIQATIDGHTTTFPWQQGDLLLVDNYLVSHGRMPFKGPRRILVAMG